MKIEVYRVSLYGLEVDVLLLINLWNFIRGYVIINVKGSFVEKFINLCANKGIYLWDIKRKMPHSMGLKVSVKGFKAIRGVAKKTRCKINIVRKVGFPFIKYRYRRRKSFLAGFVIFFAIIYILSSFVWVIEVHGVKKVKAQIIVDFLAKNGIKPGILKFKFDKDKIVADMLINIDELSWIDIKHVGTKIIVETVERIPTPPILDRVVPCNIYSRNDGVVKSIITRNGVAVVREGDVIRKGQLLVTGIIENKLNLEDVHYVHSDAVINAITWYQGNSEINKNQIKRERTGDFKAGYNLKVFSDYYNIFRPSSPYKNFDYDEKTIRFAFWKNYELPIEFVVKKYYEVNNKNYILTEEQMKSAASKLAIAAAEKVVLKTSKVTDKKVEFQSINENKTIVAKATIECIEEVGEQHPIEKE